MAPASVAAVPPIDMPSHWAPNFAIIAFAVVLSAIVFAWVYSAFVAQPDIELTPTAPVPTATPFDEDIPVPTIEATFPPPTAEPTQVSTPTQTTTSGTRETSSEDGRSEERGGDNQRADAPVEQAPVMSEETQAGEQEAAAAEPTEVPQSTLDESDTLDESELTSIQVTALSDIYVSITADGAVVFDDNLAAGETSGYVTGNTFEVYTSSGASTRFTDACGGEFMMGYEPGEATYSLQKNVDSCPPVE